MRLPRMLLVVGYLLRCHVARSIAVNTSLTRKELFMISKDSSNHHPVRESIRSHKRPAPAASQALLDETDVTLRDDSDNDITTEEPFLKKCIVDGKFYSHGQTIPSSDVNSHCLCVVGEVYCWWQNYNSNIASSLGPSSLRSTAVESNYTSSLEMSTDIVGSFEASGNFDSSISEQGHKKINTTPSVPAICLVMGREYRQGEILPHSTGNCVECSCGSEGRIECSPRDCVALRPEILVAPDKPEVPDGDFEVFNLARDWDVDENF